MGVHGCIHKVYKVQPLQLAQVFVPHRLKVGVCAESSSETKHRAHAYRLLLLRCGWFMYDAFFLHLMFLRAHCVPGLRLRGIACTLVTCDSHGFLFVQHCCNSSGRCRNPLAEL